MVDRVRPEFDPGFVQLADLAPCQALAGFEFLVAVADERRGQVQRGRKIRAGAGPERPQYRSRGTRRRM